MHRLTILLLSATLATIGCGAASAQSAASFPERPIRLVLAFGPGGLAFPMHSSQLQVGAAAHLFYTDRYTPLTRASDAGLGWIRQQIHWRDQEGPAGNYAWGELDDIVADVNAHNLKLLISIVRSPTFYTADGGDGMPEDPQALGNFVAALAEHYRHGAVVEDLRQQRNRLDIREQRNRLVQLSELLDGMVHVDADKTRQLSERIARLEDELQALIATARPAAE